MKSLLSFTVEHFLLFQATLLQYAHFTRAQNIAQGNLSTCTGCVIHAEQTILTYPQDVREVVTSQSVTVIPYITVYENGNVTNWSTYTLYNSQSANAGLAAPPPPLTWETLGTTLTYPTTYVAYPEVSAGTAARAGGTCTRSLAQVTLQPTDQARLIFATGTGVQAAAITNSAKSVLDTIPGISPYVAPFPPARCSKGLGLEVLGTLTKSEATEPVGGTLSAPMSSAEAIVHTSVKYLTTQGPASIIRRTGNAPPQEQSTPPSNGGQGGNPNQPNGPTITWGGSTYTGKPGGGWNFGQGDLTAGGPAQTISGTIVSVADGGNVVFNGRTTTPGAAQTSGPAQANNGGDGQARSSPTTWFAGGVIGMLGMFVGIYL